MIDEDRECIKIIGSHRTKDMALAAVERLKSRPGFRVFPGMCDVDSSTPDSRFHVGEYPLDKWSLDRRLRYQVR
ncbi:MULTISPECIES: hypothetical protein [Dyella]|uniref:hypothetical protein n=1 Tax=Dyella TaxID=231454 RepID=UPI00197A7BCF|nr:MULTISPECIES: hypothetical protein [Dyella]